MLWDLLQQSQINRSRQSADTADFKASVAQANIEQLETQVQTLSLACQAMWELLGKSYGVSEIDLLNKMTEIDLRDGVMDGKLSLKAATKCHDCGKEIKKVRSNCYWCGAKLMSSTPFIK
jgi:rRNA maturation endonuclease Nob1